jgi:hypothetical protein
MNNHIDFRKEFDEMMGDFGHAVLLHRSGRKIRCRCWSEKYQEADSDCMLCGATGWVSRVERHDVRRDPAVQIVSQPNLNKQTKIGKMWVDAQNFWMKHNVHPQVGDYIYEVGWKGSKPTHLVQAYVINDVRSLRGDHGRIEYWSVSCKGEIMNKSFKNMLVRSIGRTKNYEMLF